MKEFQKCNQALKIFGERLVRPRTVYAGYQFSVDYRQLFYGGFEEEPTSEYLFYTPKRSFKLEDGLIVPRANSQSVIITDVKAFTVLNEIKFGKLTVVIPNDETLIAIMVSEYIATQIPLNQNVLDTLLTHSDPSKSHSIYITLGSNNKNIDFNRFCTLIDRYEKFFDDFEDDDETYTEDEKKEETVTLIEHKPNEHANKNRQTNINNNNNNNRPNQQKHINKQSHKNDNQSFVEIDEDFFLDENEEDDDKGYKNSNENK